jgi:hypothetical protein
VAFDLVRRRIGTALVIAGLLTPLFLAVPATAKTADRGSTVGVVVDPPPATVPRPAPDSPSSPGAGPGSGSVSNPSAPTIEQPSSPGAKNPAARPLVEDPGFGFSAPQAMEELRKRSGFAGMVDSVSQAARDFFSGLASGKPVAEILEGMLSEEAAAVVVPAVRTASTFAFPIGLAAAVFAFLILQQRIDASDPKLTAAPLAHDDDMVDFR